MIERQTVIYTILLGLWCICRVPEPVAQSLMDDPAFAAFRQATEAFNRQDYQQTTHLARVAVMHYPQHLMAHYLLGQVALVEMRWDEAVQAFATVVSLYPQMLCRTPRPGHCAGARQTPGGGSRGVSNSPHHSTGEC